MYSVYRGLEPYELAHRKNFPAMLVGSRIVVPKDRLLAWVDRKVSEQI